MRNLAKGWALVATLALLVPAAMAEEKKVAKKEYKPGEPFPCCEQHCRPKLTCHAECKIEKVKRHCYEVECKEICIPAVTFPWQKKHGCCAPPRCGRVRIVRSPKKKEYECDKEVCKWNLEPKCEPCCEPACEPHCPTYSSQVPGTIYHEPAPAPGYGSTPAEPLRMPTPRE